MKLKRSILSFLSLVMVLSLLTVFWKNNIIQAEDEPMQNDYYTIINEDGSVTFVEYEDNQIETVESNDYVVMALYDDEENVVDTYDTYEEALDAVNKLSRARTVTTYEVATVADTKSITYGVARILGYTEYTEYDGTSKGRTGYTHGSSANDAAYIATLNDGATIRVKQAGVYMDIPAENVEVTEYSSSSQVSYYQGQDGVFRHYYYAGAYSSTSNNSKKYSTQVGYTPDYLQDGFKYYSYDGHYFYTDYAKMILDYQSGVDSYSRSVNKNQPYYNYYQYLSFRAPTKFNADQLNAFVDKAIQNYSSVDESSKLKDQGQALMNCQNKNGTNASLMLGVSINESAWGMSSYAQNRNNLFGIGAVDSDPDKAKSFDTVEDCFNYFAYNTISAGYLDCVDWRYRGPHLGDKRSGINVKYASDPYWGEKAASFSYMLNDDNGDLDYENYQIGIANQGKINFYQEEDMKNDLFNSAASDSTNENVYDFPVTLISTSTNCYKIYGDTPLLSNRTSYDSDGYYDASRDYVYVNKNDVTLVNEAKPVYKKGDVNGDGKVTSLDYIQIKNHIMGTKVLSGDTLKRADVNEDGKVTSLDYIKIKNHIMGTNLLFE